MIDTIILQIPIDYSIITDHDKFKPSTKNILKQIGFFKYINNQKIKDTYTPRLTIIKRGYKIYLKVEFSIPKLLFGNNLDEVENNDFEKITSKLRKIIKEMGVKLWSHQVEKAEVTSFHPSKNIPLTKGYTASFAIRELSKINLHQKLDLERVSFRNDGESLQFYSNRHSLVMYDKINDLTKPSKRAIDKDQLKSQIDLFKYIKTKEKNLEVLRIEIRLSHRTKMKEILKEINFTEESIFKNIFKQDVCQKTLNLYWNKFFGKDKFIFSAINKPQSILQLILIKYPRTKPRKAIFLMGLHLLCKDEQGIRGLRSILQRHKQKGSWIRFRNFLKKFEDEIFTKSTHGFITDIERSLTNFNKFRLKNRKAIHFKNFLFH